MHASRALNRFGLTLLTLALSLPPAGALAYDGMDDVQGSIGFDQVFTDRMDIGKACAAQTDGKIIIAGTITSNDGEGHQIGVVRVGINGVLDPTFGNGGKVVIDLSSYSLASTEGNALAVAVDANQNVVVAGTARSGYGSHPNYGIAFRLLPDGSRDFDWAVTGVWEYSGVSQFTAIGFDPSGRLWLVGPEKIDNTGGWDYSLLDENGYYSGGGLIDRDYTSSFPTALAFDPAGNALVGGFGQPTPFANFDMLVSRIKGSDLLLDRLFGINGIGQYDLGGMAFLRSLAVMPDRRIMMSGEVGPNLAEDIAVVTMDPDGHLYVVPPWTITMVSFGLPQGGDGSGGNNRAVVQSDGKIIVAGTAFTGDPADIADAGVVRLTPYGAADFGFGGNPSNAGRVFDMPPVGNGNGNDLISCLTLAAGKPVLVGSGVWSGTDFDFSFKRLGNSMEFADGFESGSTFFWSATAH